MPVSGDGWMNRSPRRRNYTTPQVPGSDRDPRASMGRSPGAGLGWTDNGETSAGRPSFLFLFGASLLGSRVMDMGATAAPGRGYSVRGEAPGHAEPGCMIRAGASPAGATRSNDAEPQVHSRPRALGGYPGAPSPEAAAGAPGPNERAAAGFGWHCRNFRRWASGGLVRSTK